MRKLLMFGLVMVISIVMTSGCVATDNESRRATPTSTTEELTTTTVAPAPPETTSTTTIAPAPDEAPDDASATPPAAIIIPDEITVGAEGEIQVPTLDDGTSTLDEFLAYLNTVCTEMGIPCDGAAFGYGLDPNVPQLAPSRTCDTWGRCYDSYSVWGTPYGCDIYGVCGTRDIWGNSWSHCNIYGCHPSV